MKYFIDTADLNEIEKWKHLVEGITTNPSILRKNNVTDFDDFYSELEKIKKFKHIFIQVRSWDEFEKLHYRGAGNIVVKIPLVKDCYPLFKKFNNCKTCGTITYDLFQFQKACDLGCDFCIALHSKNENPCFVAECMEIIEKYDYKTKIIAASFREKRDVLELLELGVDYVTVPPAIMEKIFINSDAEKDFKKFYEV